MSFSESTLARFAKEVAKYPADQKQSAVMACLAIVQQEQGWVSAESEKGVADYLGMAPIAVHEVTTFYNMYNQQPLGRYKLNVCTNLPCQLRDGQTALDHLCRQFRQRRIFRVLGRAIGPFRFADTRRQFGCPFFREGRIPE